MTKRQQKELTILPYYTYTPFEKTNKLLKIHNDGNHYVGVEILPNIHITRTSFKMEPSRIYFNEQYRFLLQKKEKHPKQLIRDIMLAKYPNIENISNYITTNIKRFWSNLYSRLKRLRRKANLNEWNYWTTFTYDSNKHDEESFRKKLSKCLSNLHSRRGWKYMGVWEHGEDGRLHFHVIMYIPPNQMIGEIEEKKDWSTKQHKIQITHSNSFFAEKFGRNDFEEISEYELKNGSVLNYLTKYISKTNERIVYSRGIPSELTLVVNNEDIATEYLDYRTTYVLFDNFAGQDVFNYYNDNTMPKTFAKLGQINIFNSFSLCSS